MVQYSKNSLLESVKISNFQLNYMNQRFLKMSRALVLLLIYERWKIHQELLCPKTLMINTKVY